MFEGFEKCKDTLGIQQEAFQQLLKQLNDDEPEKEILSVLEEGLAYHIDNYESANRYLVLMLLANAALEKYLEVQDDLPLRDLLSLAYTVGREDGMMEKEDEMGQEKANTGPDPEEYNKWIHACFIGLRLKLKKNDKKKTELKNKINEIKALIAESKDLVHKADLRRELESAQDELSALPQKKNIYWEKHESLKEEFPDRELPDFSTFMKMYYTHTPEVLNQFVQIQQSTGKRQDSLVSGRFHMDMVWAEDESVDGIVYNYFTNRSDVSTYTYKREDYEEYRFSDLLK